MRVWPDKNRIFFLGAGVAFLYWLIETLMDVVIFETGNFTEQVLPLHDYNEAWMRFITISIILLFGYVAQRMHNKIVIYNKELEQTGEELRINSEILEKGQKMAHVGSWHLDVGKNILTWSDEVYRIFGLQPRNSCASYEAFLEIVHPDDREMVDKLYTNSIKNKTPYDVTHRIVRPDGEVRVVYEKSENVTDTSGRIIHAFAMVHDITEIKQNEEEKEKLISQLQKSLSEIKTLRGIIPICSYCKKIRDDKGFWNQVEMYLMQHTEADFSHGICTECFKKHYPELGSLDDNEYQG